MQKIERNNVQMRELGVINYAEGEGKEVNDIAWKQTKPKRTVGSHIEEDLMPNTVCRQRMLKTVWLLQNSLMWNHTQMNRLEFQLYTEM